MIEPDGNSSCFVSVNPEFRYPHARSVISCVCSVIPLKLKGGWLGYPLISVVMSSP